MKPNVNERKALTVRNVAICLSLAGLTTMVWLAWEGRDAEALTLGILSTLGSLVALYHAYIVKGLRESSPRRGAFYVDEEAVSPVIAVILMVAITVVLAATVFVLVQDIGGEISDAPAIGWTQDTSEKTLMVTSIEAGHTWGQFNVTGCDRPAEAESVDPGDKLTNCAGDVTVVYTPGRSLVYSTKF